MHVSDDLQRAVFHAGLLHDVGVPAASVGLAALSGVDEELVFAFAPTGDLRAAEVPLARG